MIVALPPAGNAFAAVAALKLLGATLLTHHDASLSLLIAWKQKKTCPLTVDRKKKEKMEMEREASG